MELRGIPPVPGCVSLSYTVTLMKPDEPFVSWNSNSSRKSGLLLFFTTYKAFKIGALGKETNQTHFRTEYA